MAQTPKTSGPAAEVEYEIETGLDANLPFSMPYQAHSDGTARRDRDDSGRPLREIGRGWEEEGPSVRQLVTMRRQDGQARALYRLLTLPILSALSTATFVPADDGEEERDFIDAVFNTPPTSGGMSVTFHRVMSQILQGLFDGFSAFEKVFWVPNDGPLKGKVTLKKLAYRPSDTVTFITDDHGSFRGIRQQANFSGTVKDVFIPRDYCFYYAANEEERKFYGVSFFQSAFYHYDKKVKLYYIAHLGAQRAAVGTRIGTVPANASESSKRKFSKMLANLSVAQWMMLPEGFKAEVLRDAGSFDFLSLINHHNSQMSKSLLANFFDQSQGGGSSDTSLVNFAQPGDDMFVLMLRAIMNDIANQINHYIIPQLVDLNFKGGKYPKFTWGKLTDKQKSAIASIFDKIAASAAHGTLPKEFVRALEKQQAEEMGLEINWDEVEQREAEEAAAEAQQATAPGGVPGAPAAPVEAVSEEDLIAQFEQEMASLTGDDDVDALVRLAREMLDVS